jgi:predicted Zn-dependent protease
MRAHSLAAAGDRHAAARELESLSEAGRAAGAAQVLRAQLALDRGDAPTAVGLLRSLAADARSMAGIHAMLGRALAAAGRDEEAEASFRRALADEPQDAGTLAQLAALRLRAGDAEGALDLGLRSAALDMRQAAVHMTVGRAFLALGSPGEAVNAFAACVAQAPGWNEAREALAAARRASGQGA